MNNYKIGVTLRILGILVLVFGFIGSIWIANRFGVETKMFSYSGKIYTERNGVLTVTYFVSGMFGAIILSSILVGIGKVMERIEDIAIKIQKLDKDEKKDEKVELPPL